MSQRRSLEHKVLRKEMAKQTNPISFFNQSNLKNIVCPQIVRAGF